MASLQNKPGGKCTAEADEERSKSMRWTKADPANIGKVAYYDGVQKITFVVDRVSDYLFYYFDASGDIYPSFLCCFGDVVEAKKKENMQ